MPSTASGPTAGKARARPRASASTLTRCSMSLSARRREVEEVAGAAGRVEDAEAAQAFEEAGERGSSASLWARVAAEADFAGLLAGEGGLDLGLRLGPFGEQRLDDDRAHDLHDLVAVGVVGAELAALGRVEAALEQRAEDRGVDLATSRGGRPRAGRSMSARSSGRAASSSNRPPLNQSTRVKPTWPPVRIAAKSGGGVRRRSSAGSARQASSICWNSFSGSRPTSSANMQKTRRLTKWATAWASWPRARSRWASVGEFRRRPRRSGRRGSSPGCRRSGSVKAARSRSRLAPSSRSSSGEGVRLLDGVGPVGADDDAVHVADDEQRRVLQRAGVAAGAGGRRRRGPCAGPCTPSRSSPCARRRPSPRRRWPWWRPSRR